MARAGEGAGAGPGMMPIERAELATRDMDQIADLIRQQYVEHRPRFRVVDPARAEASHRATAAGSLMAGCLRWQGVEYQLVNTQVEDALIGAVVLHGGGTLTTGREEVRLGPGDVHLASPSVLYDADLHECTFAVVQVPWAAATALAEEQAGLPAADLRFESLAPVTGAAGALWSRTARFACRQLIESGDTEISPLLAQEMTQMVAAVMLRTFPSTTMTVPYLPGPGWAPPAAVHRAAEFMEAHADQPVTTAQIAAAAGVTPRALQDAFRRHQGITPTGYLRGIRLERAHQELAAADPASGDTVRAVARRWGWFRPSAFTWAYRQRFGVPPGRTLWASAAGTGEAFETADPWFWWDG
jgi:AraC-like DNA-binding protein